MQNTFHLNIDLLYHQIQQVWYKWHIESHTLPSSPEINTILPLYRYIEKKRSWSNQSCISIPQQGWNLDVRVSHYVFRSSLRGVSRLATMNINHALVAALVKCQRQETHTKQLLADETLVTSEDVVVLLRIEGPPAIALTTQNDIQMSSQVFCLCSFTWQGRHATPVATR